MDNAESKLFDNLRGDIRDLRKEIHSLSKTVYGFNGKLNRICSDVERLDGEVSELQTAKGEITGKIDVFSKKNSLSSSGFFRKKSSFLLKVILWSLPIIVSLSVGLGIFWGSGGERDAIVEAMKTMAQIEKKIEALEKHASLKK